MRALEGRSVGRVEHVEASPLELGKLGQIRAQPAIGRVFGDPRPNEAGEVTTMIAQRWVVRRVPHQILRRHLLEYLWPQELRTMGEIFTERISQTRKVHVRVDPETRGGFLFAIGREPSAQGLRAGIPRGERACRFRQRLRLGDQSEEATFQGRQPSAAHDSTSRSISRARDASASTTGNAGTASSHSTKVETRPKH